MTSSDTASIYKEEDSRILNRFPSRVERKKTKKQKKTSTVRLPLMLTLAVRAIRPERGREKKEGRKVHCGRKRRKRKDAGMSIMRFLRATECAAYISFGYIIFAFQWHFIGGVGY